MIEVIGNIWDFHARGKWICITTNGSINRFGECVMGRGVALQAKQRFPTLPRLLGNKVRFDNRFSQINVYAFTEFKIVCFPVKFKWYLDADCNLIILSCWGLTQLLDTTKIDEIYLPRPGCGNGNLTWEEVKPVVAVLDDRVKVISLG